MPAFWQAAYAQITPDNTLPTPSIVSNNGTTLTITGGTQSGTHLFHSFENFSIVADETAAFDHALDLSSIITRVTGSSASAINGTLSTQGTTDFFLLNPNGIVFGETATLNVGGSFIATTADALQFGNGLSFSAVDPQAPPLLTVNLPTGLQYGQQPGAITVNGPGHNLTIDADTLEVITSDRPPGLSVNQGHTLALLGGAITLDGGNLNAPEGRVSLAAIGDNNRIALEFDALGWRSDTSTVTAWQPITLDNAGSIVTTGDRAGAVQISGQLIDLLAGSTILANTLRNQVGNEISLDAADEILLSGTRRDGTTNAPLFPSSIFAEVALDATGDGGDIILSAPFISLDDGAQVSTSVLGQGQGGDITVRADQVELVGGQVDPAPSGLFLPSGFFLDVADVDATGTGGNLDLQTEQLIITAGAQISASTFGPGNGGSITTHCG